MKHRILEHFILISLHFDMCKGIECSIHHRPTSPQLSLSLSLPAPHSVTGKSKGKPQPLTAYFSSKEIVTLEAIDRHLEKCQYPKSDPFSPPSFSRIRAYPTSLSPPKLSICLFIYLFFWVFYILILYVAIFCFLTALSNQAFYLFLYFSWF